MYCTKLNKERLYSRFLQLGTQTRIQSKFNSVEVKDGRDFRNGGGLATYGMGDNIFKPHIQKGVGIKIFKDLIQCNGKKN